MPAGHHNMGEGVLPIPDKLMQKILGLEFIEMTTRDMVMG